MRRATFRSNPMSATLDGGVICGQNGLSDFDRQCKRA
jgi:hypothetical protein